jgi:hypothetical protein
MYSACGYVDNISAENYFVNSSKPALCSVWGYGSLYSQGTPHSLGPLWTSGDFEAEASAWWQHSQEEKIPCPKRDWNPHSRQVKDRRPTPQTAWPLRSTHCFLYLFVKDRILLYRKLLTSSTSALLCSQNFMKHFRTCQKYPQYGQELSWLESHTSFL